MPDALEELRALNARFIHNFVTNDVARHDAILHPAFLCISSSGQRISRADYLVGWATGFDPEVYLHWDTRDEHITLLGDVALVRATNKWVMREAGRETSGMTAYTDTYLREGGRWLCIQAQLTPVAPPHFPTDASVVNLYLKGVKRI